MPILSHLSVTDLGQGSLPPLSCSILDYGKATLAVLLSYNIGVTCVCSGLSYPSVKDGDDIWGVCRELVFEWVVGCH